MTLDDALTHAVTEALVPFLAADPLFPLRPSLITGIERSFLVRIGLHLSHLSGSAWLHYQRIVAAHDLDAMDAFLAANVLDPEALLLAVLAESR